MSILLIFLVLQLVTAKGETMKEKSLHLTRDNKSYTFIFLTVGLVSLLPLTILASILSLRSSLSGLVRLVCFCTTMTLSFGLAGVSLVYFGLAPIHLILARGDQVHLGGIDTQTVFSYYYYRLACSHLTVRTNQPGVRVWAVSVAVNRMMLPYNYSLVLANQSLPTVLHISLNTGDLLQVGGQTNQTNTYTVLLKGRESWQQWQQVGFSQTGSYEKCCAWKVLDKNTSNQIVKVDATDMYTIIIRNTLVEQEKLTDQLFTGSIELSRSRWSPTQCDPIVCDIPSSVCLIESITYHGYIMEYEVHRETAPPYGEANIEIYCHPRHWALALVFAFIPAIVTVTIVVIWRCRFRYKLRFSEPVFGSADAFITAPPREETIRPATTGNYRNAAFEMDIV